MYVMTYFTAMRSDRLRVLKPYTYLLPGYLVGTSTIGSVLTHLGTSSPPPNHAYQSTSGLQRPKMKQ